MSETTPPTNGAGAAPEEINPPVIAVLAQYLKDLSFESPRAPNVFQNNRAPKIDANVDVNVRVLNPNQHEVELTVSAKANYEDDTIFIVEASYAGVFEVKNIPREQLEPVMLVECPRMLFPFLRQIIAEATRNGNFPPLMLEPLDFASLYMDKRRRQAAAAEAGQSQDSSVGQGPA